MIIFLTLALIASIATSVHFYILLVSNRKSSEESINILSGIIADNEKSRRQAEEQYNEEIKKLLAENGRLSEQVKKLSQKELIEECRAFYNALEQRKKDILAALNSLESSFNAVKRVCSAQTTIDDCITTIKPMKSDNCEFKLDPTIRASGMMPQHNINLNSYNKFWNGDQK